MVLSAHAAHGSGAATPAPSLRCDEGLGFSPAELAQAVALRVPPGVAVANLRVTGGPDFSTVDVILGSKRRSVALGDRRGGLAARWVALTVVDLILGEAVPP